MSTDSTAGDPLIKYRYPETSAALTEYSPSTYTFYPYFDNAGIQERLDKIVDLLERIGQAMGIDRMQAARQEEFERLLNESLEQHKDAWRKLAEL